MPSMAAIINANAAGDGWFAFTNDCVETRGLLNLIFPAVVSCPNRRLSSVIS